MIRPNAITPVLVVCTRSFVEQQSVVAIQAPVKNGPLPVERVVGAVPGPLSGRVMPSGLAPRLSQPAPASGPSWAQVST